MMSFEKEPELPDPVPMSRGRRWLVIVSVVVVGVAGGGFAWWKLVLEKKAVAPPTLAQAEIAGKLASLDARIAAIRQTLTQLQDAREIGQQRALIEEAILKQNELMRLRPSTDGEDAIRLSEWQIRLDDANAAEWSRESRRLEELSATQVREKKMAEAVESLKGALQLQEQINASAAGSEMKNRSRAARLRQDVEQLETGPMQAEVRNHIAQAEQAALASRWSEAEGHYKEARAAQLKLNTMYERTRYADTKLLERVEKELATLEAAAAFEKLETSLKEAEAAAAVGKLDDADKLLASAAEQQRMLNEQYGKSRFASTERFEEIEVQRQTWRAQAAWAVASDLDRRATEHLRRRELFQAQQLVAEGVKAFDAAVVAYPKAKGVDQALGQRLTYLNLRGADLVPIQDQVYGLLLPVPGNGRVALLKTEVPQEIFQRVMSSNPSRNAGRLLAVDSVTYAEAEEFCRRLGWVLGRVVRLPDENEYRAALGELRATAANAWDENNSMNKSQAPVARLANAAGFCDLIGNLAEWLTGGAGETALLAGGSYAESLRTTQELPLKPAVKTERSRTVGFRVLVEMEPAAAGGN